MNRRVLIAALALVAVAIGTATHLVHTGRPGASGSAPAPPPSNSPSTTISHRPAATTAEPAPVWRVTWGSAMAWGYGVIHDATIRSVAIVATTGQEIRFRVSNYFGNAPLQIAAATVAPSAGASAVQVAALHPVTFDGRADVTIPAGSTAYSDPVDLAVSAQEALAISLWVADQDLVTLHPCCGTTPRGWFTPNGRGNLTTAATLAGVGIGSPWPRFVDAVDVLQSAGQGSIVVVGDSITDGFNSTARWTDILQRRVATLPPAQQRAVVNEAITANALTAAVHTDALTGGGPSGVSRLARDALSQSGVSEVVILLGTNDLWFGATAQQVIAGFRQAIAEIHDAGLPVVAMTLLPRSTDREEYWSPADQANLETVNRWIRTSGAFNGVIDAARAVADVYAGDCKPNTMFTRFDSGDHIHPNAAGQTAIANYIDPALLGLPPMRAVSALVPATPTRECPAAPAPAGQA